MDKMDLVLQICLLLALGLNTHQYRIEIDVKDNSVLRSLGLNPMTINLLPKDFSIFGLINWISGIIKKPIRKEKITSVTATIPIIHKPKELILYDQKKVQMQSIMDSMNFKEYQNKRKGNFINI